ncbi:hypothetical protein LIER_19431 [Lithospermum erythrorhizon]|uniref:FRIGIDA-like protein n=1 Tax=Lithospermum erythrorhizon TaxID=34254 RepID=A0AAV3QLI7_LITER
MTEPETTTPPPSATPSPPHTTSPLPIIDLHTISTALSAFNKSINDLQFHLHTLQFTLDTIIAKNPSTTSQIAITPPSKPNSPQNSTTLFDIDPKSNGIVKKVSKKWGEIIDLDQELKNICEKMDFRGLKRYIMNNLYDIGKLRLEVPKALKYARNAARLVLNCCGRFFLQTRLGYVKDSMLVMSREASVVILECFLLMEGGGGGNESKIDDDVKNEADSAVVLWKKRMMNEGGIMRACESDARGLLLLLGGYGVPLTFRSGDLGDLFRASNGREMVGTLRRASSLVERVPEIIEVMIQNKLEVDAIDVAYTFGLEERFNVQTILTSFLQQIKEPSEKVKKSSASPAEVVDANREQLASLKSFAKCLEGHKIDSSKIISLQEIQKKISRLEEDIFYFDKKSIAEYDKGIRAEKIKKRKAEEVETEAEAGRRSEFREDKLSCYTDQRLQSQKVGHNSQRSLFDTGMAGHVNDYAASQSVLHARVPGTGYAAIGLEENHSRYTDQSLQFQKVGHYSQRSLYNTGMDVHMSGDQVPGTGCAAVGAYGGMDADPSGHVIDNGVQSYGWHEDPTLTERVVTHNYAAQPSSSSTSSLYRPASPSLEGYEMLPSGSSTAIPNRRATTDSYAAQLSSSSMSRLYRPSSSLEGYEMLPSGSSTAILNRSATTDSYTAQLSSSSMSRLYRPASSSLEGYVMLPSGSSIDVPNRGATTDLYKFVDTIDNTEYHPTVVSSYRTSYPY